MTELAISIRNVGKMYRLYDNPADKVFDAFGVNRWLFWRKNYHQEMWALRGLNLEVKQGERLGLIGRNGAGKSTLLKVITGNISPTEGTVKVKGRVQALMELGTGFHPEFTGRQNIRASLAYQGFSHSDIREKEEEIIDFSELEDFIDQPIKTYSAGMYARLAFSTATSVQPEILIIDEVLGAGDAYFAGKCVERMRKLTEESGATVLFVSHDLSSVQKLCSRIIWIQDGKILMSGRSHEVVKEYIRYVNNQTETRLRARDMRLSKQQAKAIINHEENIYQKMLFRFRTNRPHPEGKHIIYEINLFSGLPNLHDSTVVAKINIGSPMDNNSSLPNYVIDNRKTTDWTVVIRDGETFYRCYANVGGKDCHAPFVLSVPNYILQENQDKKLYLEVKHSNSKEELIYLEYFDTSEYKFIGELNQSVSNSFYSSVFEIPFMLKSDEQGKSLPTSQKQIQIHAIHQRDEKQLVDNDNDKECVLKSVEFILKSGKSTKVVPIGEYLRVDIYYEAYSPILDPVFAITIHGIDGNQMDHKNNKLLGKNIKEINGKGKASFIFNPFRLGAGEYNVSVAILKYLSLENWHDVPPCYDRHDRQYSLFVSTESKNLGMVVQESEFEIISNL